jgi:hypothetical protein
MMASGYLSLSPLAAVAATNHQTKAIAAAIRNTTMVTIIGPEDRFCESGGELINSNEYAEQ